MLKKIEGFICLILAIFFFFAALAEFKLPMLFGNPVIGFISGAFSLFFIFLVVKCWFPLKKVIHR